ncbi:DEAD/DEAH box helicase [Pseudoalteromonas denitrificans]|uniref:Superfamily II DNA and RNA helicase n=1 Tax=Pseudoalteromonas denitrificans DSM 6059 TaxID=1123010 RepID=A0A1I1PJ33_9GAMM|nr:DEAD/DEAH box helicase [Pseudoalteromonas denitrificans]SFD09757.1 Superfamily II DNA and RNA helicase [Pseudoalteromonas denitrificans DSM 6059]
MQFETLGIDIRLAKQLAHQAITEPTEIQQKAIPVAITGKDLFAQSKTGSGKTLAFLLPALQRVLKQKALSKRDPRVLIITPTRELANQVFTQLRMLIAGTNLLATKVLGGDNFNEQIKALRKDPQFIVATPGRLADHLKQKSFYLSGLEMLILDEADRMMDLGFKEELQLINTSADHRLRQTLMFSATLEHAELDTLSSNLLNKPKKVIVGSAIEKHDDITQNLFLADHLDHKEALLNHFISQKNVGQCIIFTATRGDTQRLSSMLNEKGFNSAALSGDMSQNKRLKIMDAFSREQYQILVTTDVASRGLDLLSVTHVINFDLPKNSEEYVHRIGRTGRAGFKGHAISFIGPKDWNNFLALQKYLQQEFTFLTVDGLKGKFKGIKDKTVKKPTEKIKKNVKKVFKKSTKTSNKKNKAPIPAPFDIDGQSPLKRKPRVNKETPIQDIDE